MSIQLQIPVLVAVPSPAIVYNDDDDNNKPNHLTTLVAFGEYITHVFETIVEYLPTPTIKDNNNNDDDDNKEEVEEMEEEL